MPLAKERIETLLLLLKDKSPKEGFLILSQQLNLDMQYTSAMSPADLKRLYRKICLLVHPDKLDEKAKLAGHELLNFVKFAYNHLAFPNQDKSLSCDVDDSVLELHLFFLQRQKGEFNLSEDVTIDLIDALIFPEPLPPECYESGGLAYVSEKIWQLAEQNLTKLTSKLEEKEFKGALKDGAERVVFFNRNTFVSLFRRSQQSWRQLTEANANPTLQNFIQTYLLPKLRTCVQPHRSLAFDFPYVRDGSSYISSISLHLRLIFGFSTYGAGSLHKFLRDKSLEERKQLYYVVIQQLEIRVKDDKYLDQCCMEMINTKKQYVNHYSGLFGNFRFYYRSLFDRDAFQAEQRALETLENNLNHTYLPLLSEVISFGAESYTIPEIELPTLDANQSPFLFALVARLQEVNAAYRLSKSSTREQVQTLYHDIANKALVYQNISKEMGTLGFFGAFGPTRTRERCLHALKQSILSDLITEADSSKDHTVTVPSETLDIIGQHNGRFWRFGKTNTQAKFDEAFELVSPKDESSEALYRYRYSH